MSKNSKIEWTDHTFNPWIGCTKVSPGCDNCYAAVSTPARTRAIQWGAGLARRRTTSTWSDPKHWNDEHDAFFAQHGRRQRVFCASLADVFDNEVPEQWRCDLLQLIDLTPNLDWLLLTKRIGNVVPMLKGVQRAAGGASALSLWPRPNVWLGATIVNQAEADRDIPKLLATPARVRFLSLEPLLGPVDLTRIDVNGHSEIYPLAGTTGCEDDDGNPVPDISALNWVIVGGESGHAARPMSIQWARSLRDQCAAAGVPFLFKQWGEWAPAAVRPSESPGQFAFGDYEHDAARFVQTDRYPRAFTSFGARCILERVGKKAAGRLLDGVEHNGFPEAST